LWIGKVKQSKDKVEHISWTNKPIQSLGIYFGHDKIECEKLNWENKIDKMNSLLFLPCSKRNLSRAMISTDKTNNKADNGYFDVLCASF
jgi:hypothetical protein